MEREILDFMVQYLRANTYQPSIREIGRRFGIKSTKTVSEHLHALSEKGFLERDSSRSRGVRILGVDLSTGSVAVPCYAELPDDPATAAGPDVPRISIDRRLGGGEGSFFLRAGPGDLAVLGLEEGDLVLVSPSPEGEWENGSVLVARTGYSGSIFHRVGRNGRGLSLEALVPGGERVLVEDAGALKVFGRVAGFYRRLGEAGSLNPLTRH
jgi:repressor LexA